MRLAHSDPQIDSTVHGFTVLKLAYVKYKSKQSIVLIRPSSHFLNILAGNTILVSENVRSDQSLHGTGTHIH